jgi:hypothetical protein
MMKFFDQDWHSGVLDDAEYESRSALYSEHVSRLFRTFPRSLYELTTSPVMHDALVRGYSLDKTSGILTLQLRGGDLQRGYEDIDISYDNAVVPEESSAVLQGVTGVRDAELISDEIDVDHAANLFVHRMVFAPFQEVEIRFANVAVLRRPVADRFTG